MTTPEIYSTYPRETLTDLRETLSGQLEHVFGPVRGGLLHELWVVEKALGMHAAYFSNSGQDKFLNDTVLNNREGGVFLELGGYDGITGSNTLFFEKELGWTGLLIEPVPSNHAQATSVRRCTCLNTAVGTPAPEAAFLEIRSGYTQSGGLIDSIAPDLLERIRQHPEHDERIARIPVRSIRDILQEAGIHRIDYVSLDVEGGEMAVLKEFPFETVPVETWSIENISDSPEIPSFMAGKGYEVIEFIGIDEIYRAT
ncbi:FkbM family methyltransferase [Roseibium sp. FZY0029]|uniref:FkbM family methyltransferase n=1 Tax=Roseibium sp. FZY0029 TaxID=3116647 RepID=UPI002EB70D8F|nr:FkbM family methyltransferase [Roseibium sp. FZY0029]